MIKRYLFLLAGLVALAALLHTLAGSSSEGGVGLKQWIIPVASLYLDTFNNPTSPPPVVGDRTEISFSTDDVHILHG